MRALETWELIKSWIAKNIPKGIESIQLGASDDQASDIEDKLGVIFPSDFKEYYKIHNAQTNSAPPILPSGNLLSLEEILNQWNIWKGLHENGIFATAVSEPNCSSIRDDWWNPNWIPFTHDGHGNHLCLDLAPTENGISGQIISVYHDSPERELISNSFKDWFGGLAQEYESGLFRFNPSNGCIEKSI